MVFCGRLLSVVVIAGAAMLAACGGGGGGGGGDTGDGADGTVTEGTLSLFLTDGPVDTASVVNVRFDAVQVKPVAGEVLEFSVDDGEGYRDIDLLTLTGNVSETLLDDVLLAAGDYAWIRLSVLAELDGTLDSFIELSDGSQLELWVPSGAQSGLKLNYPFTVIAGQSLDLTVDFDLRKSVTNPPGRDGAILKPTLRVVATAEAGSIAGLVQPELIIDACGLEPSPANVGAIYVYEGADVAPVDLRRAAGSQPVTTATVELDGSGDYRYEAAFLEGGVYSAAYTCDNAADDPEAPDQIDFFAAANVEVEAGETSELNFRLP